MNRGLIFDIRRYAVHDGPGIRTSVFFKGCPLRCSWCHNPEGLLEEPETIFRERIIDGCHKKVPQTAGKWMLAAEVMHEIEKDLLFYEESGGGVTFTGGEPGMQPEFLLGLLTLCRIRGIHSAIDTSGHVPQDVFFQLAEACDMILFDVKCADPLLHKKHTGTDNKTIISNLLSLNKLKTVIMIRIPLIGGFNDTLSEMQAIAGLLKEVRTGIAGISLLPNHGMGVAKYQRMGLTIPDLLTSKPPEDFIKEAEAFFSQSGFNVKIGG